MITNIDNCDILPFLYLDIFPVPFSPPGMDVFSMMLKKDTDFPFYIYIIWTNLNNQTSVTDSLQWVSHPSGIQWCITVNELAFYPEENQKSYCACVRFCHRKTNVSTLYYLRYNAWCKLDNIFVQIKSVSSGVSLAV